ncbi:MAG: DNA-3-methyladenine glycosylase [Phycisphaerales bacterium]|nr:DNA-3-methyladenine glycosylase [Phycisphaerales bacterium]
MPDHYRLKRPDFAIGPVALARGLLGCTLVRVLDTGERLAGRIVETEAYVGARDRASHSFGGRRTERNEAMYAEPGTAYVYFTYGMHFCFNVVCGRAGQPVAVLLRALEPLEGLSRMRQHRAASGGATPPDHLLCSGPARLTQALDVTRRHNLLDLTDRASPLLLERGPQRIRPGERPSRGPRIGIDSAGDWAAKPLRFWLAGNPHTSRPGRVGRGGPG